MSMAWSHLGQHVSILFREVGAALWTLAGALLAAFAPKASHSLGNLTANSLPLPLQPC